MAKMDTTTLVLLGVAGIVGYKMYQDYQKTQASQTQQLLDVATGTQGFSINTPLFGFSIPQKMLDGVSSLFRNIFSGIFTRSKL